ncbi:MAG: hypothetical protein QF793_00775 [Candidatus Peribacteraceae bacterium]|jgi:hypothetical protein|nr:hypothetical protein [Candidatus Peribacteraceae bacterium]|tara:strand:+ start:19605 stop:20138 length:534 start_codon:yes stop_codon:yes gene_type:complete
MQRTLVNPDAILKEQKCQNGEYPQKYAIAAVERETYAQMEQVATMDAIRRLVSRSSNESNFPNRDMIRGLQNLFRQSKSALVLHKLLTERDTVDDPRWVKSWQPHKSEELTELTCGAIDEELSPSNRKRLLTFLHDEMPDLTIRCTHEWIPAHAEDLQILSSMSQEQYSRLLGNGDL